MRSYNKVIQRTTPEAFRGCTNQVFIQQNNYNALNETSMLVYGMTKIEPNACTVAIFRVRPRVKPSVFFADNVIAHALKSVA